jgi:predicted N-acyltransferase
MLELRLLERVREVPEAEWDALVGAEGSPFLEWTWLDCFEEAGCVGSSKHARAAGWLPRHLALFRDGKLVAASPAYAKGNSEGEFVFDWSWADLADRVGVRYYPKVVLAVPFTPVSGERVLVAEGEDRAAVEQAFATTAREWAEEVGLSSVHVLFPHEAEANEWAAAGFMPRLGVQFHWQNEGYATFDDFLARFSSKKRHQLRRESSQPAKDGMLIETLAPDAITPEIVNAMFTFYASTVDKFFYGRRYLNPRFFELVAERYAHRLAWVVARPRGGGAPIAGAFNVKKGKRLYGRYWGATVDVPFLHFNVCYYHGIKQCIAEGLDVFEPGAGGEHKRARGFLPTLTHSAHWLRDARLRGVIGDFLERERRAVLAHVLEERRAWDEGAKR